MQNRDSSSTHTNSLSVSRGGSGIKHLDHIHLLVTVLEADAILGGAEPWPRAIATPPSGLGATQYTDEAWASPPSAAFLKNTGYTGPSPTATATVILSFLQMGWRATWCGRAGAVPPQAGELSPPA